MIAQDNKKNTTECRTKPNAVGHPPVATPPTMLFINVQVTGLATTKNNKVEYKENLTFNPVDNVIYSVSVEKLQMTMWIVYCDPNTSWNHMDKYVVNIVDDNNLDSYQQILAGEGGTSYEILRNARYLQQFVISNNNIYYIKQYEFWSPNSQ